MGKWAVASAVATCVQTVILLTAAYFAVGQVKEASRARKLAILMPLRYDIDSPAARNNRYVLFNDLPEDLTSLDDAQDKVVDRVVVEYDNLGQLVRAKLIDFKLLASLYAPSTERCWRRVKPWVEKERDRRGGAPYADALEDFAERCIQYNERQHAPGHRPFRRHQGSRAPVERSPKAPPQELPPTPKPADTNVER